MNINVMNIAHKKDMRNKDMTKREELIQRIHELKVDYEVYGECTVDEKASAFMKNVATMEMKVYEKMLTTYEHNYYTEIHTTLEMINKTILYITDWNEFASNPVQQIYEKTQDTILFMIKNIMELMIGE